MKSPGTRGRLVLLAGCVVVGAILGAFAAGDAIADDPSGDVGTTATAVTRLGIGARPSALGYSYAALGGDATALFINPAGLATVRRLRLDLHHQQRFVDTHISSFGLAIPAGPTVIGIGAGYLDHGRVDEVVAGQPTGGTVHSSNLDVLAGVALPIGSRFHVGGRFDIRRATLATSYDDVGVAVALGAQAADVVRGIDLGFAIENLGSEQQLDRTSRSDPLPRSVRGGAAWRVFDVPPDASGIAVLGTGDLWQAKGSKFQWGLGGELAFKRIAAAPIDLAGRIGYRSGGAAADELRNLTTGFGVRFGYLSVDYAFEDYGILEDVHRVSVSLVQQEPREVAPATVADSDLDGVADDSDACPDTPLGAVVDASGCPIDADGDGVFDGLDHCPDTPRGALVSRAGCPLDTDFDGVFDGVDQCPQTRPGVRVDAVGCPVPIPRFEFPSVQFNFDKDAIQDDELGSLRDVGEAMRRWPRLRVRVAGHADATGPEAYNLQLSERRARVAAQHLLEAYPDIKAERLDIVGFGESVPVAPNQTAEGRAKNRRVRFVPLNSESAQEEPVEGGE